MLLTSLTVYSVTPAGGFHASAPREVGDEVGRGAPLVIAADEPTRRVSEVLRVRVRPLGVGAQSRLFTWG